MSEKTAKFVCPAECSHLNVTGFMLEKKIKKFIL